MSAASNFGRAWLLLSVTLAVHVADEALNDFLSVWNPLARALRESYPYLPLPVFTFEVWLGGLILAVVVLLSLSPFAYRGSRWMVPLAYFFGILSLGNGLLHIGGSLYAGRLMPGVYSAPLLLAASSYLLVRVYRRHRA